MHAATLYLCLGTAQRRTDQDPQASRSPLTSSSSADVCWHALTEAGAALFQLPHLADPRCVAGRRAPQPPSWRSPPVRSTPAMRGEVPGARPRQRVLGCRRVRRSELVAASTVHLVKRSPAAPRPLPRQPTASRTGQPLRGGTPPGRPSARPDAATPAKRNVLAAVAKTDMWCQVDRTPTHQQKRLSELSRRRRPSAPKALLIVGNRRFQQTMKKWLRAQPVQPTTIAELQALLDTFIDEYNHRRPHRSLPHRATPAARYDTMPKAMPADSRDPDTHDRIRHDRVDKAGSVTIRHNGRLHHIGIGRTYEGTCVILLVQDLDIRVVNAVTGELLRELVLNPHIDYQGTGAPKGHTRTPRK